MSESCTVQVVTFESVDGIGTITFDRPPANAYDLAFHMQFSEAITAATEDSATRVVLLRSASDRFFCAGADIKTFAANTVEANRAMVQAARDALAQIEASPKLFIALINGHCLGGGLEIAMACDMRFAAEGAYKLGLPEAKLGLLPGNGGSQRLPRIVGASHALALLASGESIEPAEALRIGLVNQLYRPESLLPNSQTFARSICQSAPLAVAACKQAVAQGAALDLQDALALEARLLETLYDTEDAQEGFNAFVEKRVPHYRGQ